MTDRCDLTKIPDVTLEEARRLIGCSSSVRLTYKQHADLYAEAQSSYRSVDPLYVTPQRVFDARVFYA